MVSNLNADLLDGQHGSYYAPLANIAGADNYIPRFNGTSAIENSIIYDDGTNVGIGTTSSSVKLSVVGGTQVSGNFYSNLSLFRNITDFAGLRFGYNSSTGAGIISPVESASLFDLDFWTYNNTNFASRMIIKASGNVGIGTTDPVSLLSISGANAKLLTGYFHQTITDLTSSALGVGGGISFSGYKTGTSALEIFGAIDSFKENSTAGDAAGAFRILTQPSAGTGLVERVRISSIGYVGISTSAPEAPLHIKNYSTIAAAGDFQILMEDTAENYPGLYFRGVSGNHGFIRVEGGDGFSFYSANSGTNAYLNVLRILENGNVGVGTTTPDRKLEILDASTPQLRLTHTDGSVYTDLQTDSSGNTIIVNTGTIFDLSSKPQKPKIYTQATEPDIPNDTFAFWKDSDDSKYYLILDIGGTQKKIELT
jgi:hypothetical protein